MFEIRYEIKRRYNRKEDGMWILCYQLMRMKNESIINDINERSSRKSSNNEKPFPLYRFQKQLEWIK